jgi:hypothetical protein
MSLVRKKTTVMIPQMLANASPTRLTMNVVIIASPPLVRV